MRSNPTVGCDQEGSPPRTVVCLVFPQKLEVVAGVIRYYRVVFSCK